ncbi:putative formate dehydrogenase (C-terminal), related to acid resistance with formate dehydrogenase/DMSO reductase, domains 1-3 and ADC-like domain [Bradyrhizobium sp. ORS 285]|uniref:FdhF/YdeP family oxidoreductase n=1 Tax=Bradyrhizobium sp. ORS 285 TaxID=115808 RepID=UPI0002409520|nr:FdhF/YdeP family oxidoreductase [Bradyrhizobium sp. ORS 285]CCD88102.1 putative formate dehydrogenase (C-terminal), related to acid resistance with formate dehydrogenase/DMSO reductase, domains 1-3 and ADC-like domain [Bradyrhizobium sp. ORS 285]SMX58912.1 putative formate dehydrogenase (C-terminal), related to acid resistance with formate dehydrogenase/DMSO reductase, domains 1-3 and ADC-like domain [Bradyrhizobium sp. ORS 285]
MAETRKTIVNSPAGGWGALNATETHLARQEILVRGNRALLSMNKPGGFDCPSCAWPDPRKPHTFEYCENGAKAVAWEATRKRATPEFFAEHTVSELSGWTDHDIEDVGRLTEPMRYNASTDKYERTTWDEAFAAIGAELRALDPRRIELYTSGRTSNEAAFLYQTFGRLLGTNNFPDCSNMCHETTTVALPESIGVGKGTVDLDDFEDCDAIFIFGQNPGTNSPRMLGYLHDMAKRGVPIVTFNPLKERGLVAFANPQNAVEMLTGGGQKISSQYFQLRVGGDIAAVQGICKAVLAAAAAATGSKRILDEAFIAQHTHGFEAFATYLRNLPWERLEHYSGLCRADMETAAEIYMKADRVIACWGMGITQHRRGGDAMQQIMNLLFLRGNVGRKGAGACPIRGHSNVQGDRTVGIYQKPKEPFLQKMDAAFGFTSPREPGHDVAQCCEAILAHEVDAFIGMGGNFFRAIPDNARVAAEVPRLRMTVYVATKPNLSHMTHGQSSWLLPCLGRTERDVQNGQVQTITVEDSFSMVHGSVGLLEPASPQLKSEVDIVCGLAKATVADRAAIDWDAFSNDYGLIRDKIEAVFPEQFQNYNARIAQPGGFRLPNGARERKWDTPTGKANFLFKEGLIDADDDAPEAPHLQLITLRSHDQFNTTVYSNDDRYRGVRGERMVVFMNARDIAALGLHEGAMIEFSTVWHDDIDRRIGGFRVVGFDIPPGCCAAYYPETNGLLPLAHRDERSNTPAAKSVPVRITAVAQGEPVAADGGVAEHGRARETDPASVPLA